MHAVSARGERSPTKVNSPFSEIWKPLFVAMGLQNTNTGTWESVAVPLAVATAQLSQALQALANPQALPGVDPQAALNHLWVYIDRV